MDLIIADVDGVFTNDRAVPNQEAIRLSAQLAVHHLVTYATGRGAPWLKQNMIPYLSEAYKCYKPIMSLIWAEYGSVLLRSGSRRRPRSFPGRAALANRIRDEVASLKGVFYDTDKEVTISVEAQHAMREARPDLVEDDLEHVGMLMKEFAKEYPQVEFQRTTYACDLTPKGTNKASACRAILETTWFTPEHVHLLGDSPSDLLLADPVIEQELPFTFWFVGDPESLSKKEKQTYQPTFSRRRYDKGTIEVLSSLIESITIGV